MRGVYDNKQISDHLMYGVTAGDMIGKPYERRKGSILCEVIKQNRSVEVNLNEPIL